MALLSSTFFTQIKRFDTRPLLHDKMIDNSNKGLKLNMENNKGLNENSLF